MIELVALTKRYGSFTAVDGIDLVVPAGQLFGFLGPNGAGKTTTLRLIAGILRPTSGRVRVAGIDIATDPLRAKAALGFIPDRPFIYEKLTGAEFLRFVAGLYGTAGEEVERRGQELLALFDLDGWRDELVESYSHGMRQKLIIASAFVHRPQVIVVDEPMVGLDPKAAKILKELFREYVRRGHTIMMSTHALDVAEALCDRIAIIQQGRADWHRRAPAGSGRAGLITPPVAAHSSRNIARQPRQPSHHTRHRIRGDSERTLSNTGRPIRPVGRTPGRPGPPPPATA